MFQELDKEKKRENETIFTPVLGRGRKKKKKFLQYEQWFFIHSLRGGGGTSLPPQQKRLSVESVKLTPKNLSFFYWKISFSLIKFVLI